MRWQIWPIIAVFTLSLTLIAWWQYREYVQERRLAEETLHRESHAVMDVLVGGFQAHRRRGRFFVEQIDSLLKRLVQSDDVLAVGIALSDGQLSLSAGQTELLTNTSTATPGDFWDATGFRLVESFFLEPASVVLNNQARTEANPGQSPNANGLGSSQFSSPFSAGGDFTATLVFDRSLVDLRCHRAAWLRGIVVAASGLLLAGIAVAWQLTIRAAGKARQLEMETRHLRELSRAASGLAHETRNPLGLIRGWAQRLAQDDGSSVHQHEQADAIVEECDRVTARINQFLSFARPTPPQLEEVDCKALVKELAVLLETDLDEKRLVLNCDELEKFPTIQADREMLRQALFNLLQNAIHASSEQQTIEFLVQPGKDGSWRIEVADRGSGVTKADVEKLFTPYFTTRQAGTGLGLAIVRHIATMHGWKAGYSPRAGGGSLFWLGAMHG